MIEYARRRDRFAITSALVIGYEGDAGHRRNNAYLATIAEDTTWALPLAYVAAERGRSALDALDDLPLDRFVGISLYLMSEQAVAGLESWTPDDWSRLPGPRIVSVNTAPAFLARIGDIAAGRPDLLIMISHFGAPPSPGPGGVSAALGGLLELAAIGTVHVKASGYYALAARGWSATDQATATTRTVQAFGANRVHWGSDFSPCLEATTFESAVSPPGLAQLPAVDRRLVQHQGMVDLLDGLTHR
ncbi:amidohydrolase family protein [Microlunatus sp. Gsoil 973]|jgi:predicted TIM-barrel fold metal-dependent hydrolase|nr:amidohydrolase family protein [Microlunatus sp. Gsoil 973]QGN34321.1 amidohydrolase family protein [Microlunatus sp. Gsoil 973]